MTAVRVVTVTEAELAALVRAAVSEALAEHEIGEQLPALFDRTALARKLGCSPSHVDTLRAEGMPTVWLGQTPRFELAPCLAWLRERRK